MMLTFIALFSLGILAATFIAGSAYGRRIANKTFAEIDQLRQSLDSWSHK